MPDVKTTFSKNEIKLLAILMGAYREDSNGLQDIVKREDIGVMKIGEKLYFKIIGLEIAASKETSRKQKK